MNNITIYQVIVAAVAFGIIVNRSVRFARREKAQSIFKYLTVVFVWGMIGSIALFPSIAHWIRRQFGFGQNFNTMIFIAFVILFVLFFRVLAIIEKIESQITEIVRKEALKNIERARSIKK